MNQAPYLLQQGRTGYRLGHGEVLDAVVQDGLWCPFENQHMGKAAEWIARTCNIGREARTALPGEPSESNCRDRFRSVQGRIVAVKVPQRKGDPCPLKRTRIHAEIPRLKGSRDSNPSSKRMAQ